MGRREEVVDASIEVLVNRSGRGFSHRAVDAAAGVPVGTTSNFFGSRRELLLAAFGHLVERFEEDGGTPLAPEPANEADLVTLLGAYMDALLQLRRTEILAFYVMLFESVTEPELADRVIPYVEAWQRSYSGYLAKLGAPEPDLGGKLIADYVFAVLLGEFADPSPDFDARAAVEPLVWGLLH